MRIMPGPGVLRFTKSNVAVPPEYKHVYFHQRPISLSAFLREKRVPMLRLNHRPVDKLMPTESAGGSLRMLSDR